MTNTTCTAGTDLFALFLGLAEFAESEEGIALAEAGQAEAGAIDAAREAEIARIAAQREAEKCGRCGGNGVIVAYKNRNNDGTCYRCDGYGYIS